MVQKQHFYEKEFSEPVDKRYLFLTASSKLLPVQNRIIWRSICDNVSDQYDGDQIWWGTSSCTENMHFMGKFVGLQGVRTLFIIECTNGKAIHAHSQYRFENEILRMPGTYLQVVDKWTPSDDLHIRRLHIPSVRVRNYLHVLRHPI